MRPEEFTSFVESTEKSQECLRALGRAVSKAALHAYASSSQVEVQHTENGITILPAETQADFPHENSSIE